MHASRYDVLSIPTVILFAEGEAQEIVVGARPREALPRDVRRVPRRRFQPRSRPTPAAAKCSQPRSSYGSPSQQQLDALARLDAADDREARPDRRPRRAARSPRRSRGRRPSRPRRAGRGRGRRRSGRPSGARGGRRRRRCRPRCRASRAPCARAACPPRAAAAGARTRRRRNAAPAAPSGPVTTSRSPGRAPARPGTRSERPSAVTLSTTCGAAVVSPPTTGTPVSAMPAVELDARRRRSVSPGAASVTTSASGSAPDAARSLRLTAAARQPRSRHDDPVEPEVHALDERVLRDDEPAARAAPRRARRPRSGRAARARRAGRAHRAARASSTARRSAGSVAARMTATPAAPARMHAPAFEASMPPIATTGDRDGARRCAPSSSRPSARVGVVLRRRLPDRPDAEVVGVRLDRLLERDAPSGRAAGPARARALGARVGLAEVHAVGAELERGVDVVVHDERRAELAEAARRARRPRPSAPSRAAARPSRPPSTARARRLEVGDDRVHPHDSLRPPVERRGVERGERVVERRRGTSPAPSRRARRPRPRRRTRRAPRRRRRAASPRRRGSSRSSRSTCSRCR